MDVAKPFQGLLAERNVPERSQPFFLRWAMTWLARTGKAPAEADTRRFFEDLGRRPGLRDWRFVTRTVDLDWWLPKKKRPRAEARRRRG